MSATSEQRRAAADPTTSAVVLAQLAAIPDLQLDIAANPSTPDDVIDWLAEHGSKEIRAALGEVPTLSDEHLPAELAPIVPTAVATPPVRPAPPPPTRRRPDGASTSGDLWAEELKYRREKQMTTEELRAEREAERSERDAARDARDLAARANEIKRWEAAWSLAHDGESPPPGLMPPATAVGRGGYGARTTGTNTMAIAALISVFFISIVGLILGNIALRQIRDTGEEGRGLALAAVAIGWVQIAIGVIGLIVFFATVASVGR